MSNNTIEKTENQENPYSQLLWILEETNESLNRARKRKNQFKARASFTKILTLVSGATLTLLLGIQFPDSINLSKDTELILRMIAFSLGVFVTLLNAFEPFFNYRSLWVEHEEAVYKLYELRRDLEFCIKGANKDEISSDVVLEYKQRLNEIWKDLSEKWLSYRRAGDTK